MADKIMKGLRLGEYTDLQAICLEVSWGEEKVINLINAVLRIDNGLYERDSSYGLRPLPHMFEVLKTGGLRRRRLEAVLAQYNALIANIMSLIAIIISIIALVNSGK